MVLPWDGPVEVRKKSAAVHPSRGSGNACRRHAYCLAGTQVYARKRPQLITPVHSSSDAAVWSCARAGARAFHVATVR